jgi:hypothetical protein
MCTKGLLKTEETTNVWLKTLPRGTLGLRLSKGTQK